VFSSFLSPAADSDAVSLAPLLAPSGFPGSAEWDGGSKSSCAAGVSLVTASFADAASGDWSATTPASVVVSSILSGEASWGEEISLFDKDILAAP